MTPMLLCRVPSIPKQYSRERLNQLATPKKDHLDEMSRPLNNVKWGTQEPLRKIKFSNSLPSSRLIKLAQPKKNFTRPELQPVPQYQFSCGRGSEIDATIRLEKRNRRATSPSARLIELAKSIHRPHIEKVDPVRKISEAAKYAVPSDRIAELAKPIKISKDFSIDRPLVQRVSQSATQMSCSDRVLELAKPNPKKCRNQPIIKKVTKGALQYQPSDRIKKLAKAANPQNYEIPRLEFWLVKEAAIKGNTPNVSPHLTVKAKRESMELAQFDPDAFRVSEAAKKAKCSARIDELAQPIKR